MQLKKLNTQMPKKLFTLSIQLNYNMKDIIKKEKLHFFHIVSKKDLNPIEFLILYYLDTRNPKYHSFFLSEISGYKKILPQYLYTKNQTSIFVH